MGAFCTIIGFHKHVEVTELYKREWIDFVCESSLVQTSLLVEMLGILGVGVSGHVAQCCALQLYAELHVVVPGLKMNF